MVVLGSVPVGVEHYAGLIVKPLYAGERVRRCTSCLALGIESPDNARSAFSWDKARGCAYAQCRRCHVERSRRRRASFTEEERAAALLKRRARKRKRMEELRQDPEALRAYRAKQARYTREAMKDPKVREASNRRQREWLRRKYSEDREWVEARLADARINYRLRKERQGKPLPVPKGSAPKMTRQGDLRIGPFRRWVEHLVAEQERYVGGSNDPEVLKRYLNQTGSPIEGAIAAQLGLGAKQLWRIRYENQTVYEDLVDYCTTRDGSISTADLYPELDDTPLQSFGRLLGLRALYGLWYQTERETEER